MIIALVGHRGAGKTKCLERWRNVFADRAVAADFIDIDEQIADGEGKTLVEIFEADGESKFRHLEREKFFSVYDKASESGKLTFVALGAGFDFEIPEDVYVIWVQRDTDLKPRTFLDRPRLDMELTPSEEYLTRSIGREVKFQNIADERILFPEGHGEFGERGLNFEERYVAGSPVKVAAIITLREKLFSHRGKLDYWLSRRRAWQGVRYELRTDLLSRSSLELALNCVHSGILSYRTDREEITLPRGSDILTDWALELGEPTFAVNVLSLHDRWKNESLIAALERLTGSAKNNEYLKAAPMIFSFQELWDGFLWQQQDPERRSFLPRSMDGNWRWFRLLMKDRQPLNYISEGRSSVADQPSIFEWVGHFNEKNRFAAVLGDPIEHSLTPAYQSEYFSQIGIPVLRIKINESTWGKDTIEILKNLGLRYAAVTSPLKYLAGLLVESPQPINTLYWSEMQERWLGTNTDIEGFKTVCKKEVESVAVWGGGGVLPAINAVYPEASYFSATTGELKSGKGVEPEVLIWATGSKNRITGVWPNSQWRPKKIIDLNYSDDSPGKEYAHLVGAAYVSGLPMFLAQANFQRDFWSQCEWQ